MRSEAAYPLLFDPQTAGGLLASVPKEHAEECVRDPKWRWVSTLEVIGKH